MQKRPNPCKITGLLSGVALKSLSWLLSQLQGLNPRRAGLGKRSAEKEGKELYLEGNITITYMPVT